MASMALMVGTSSDSLVDMPAPDDISWGLQDVSSSDAGRVNDSSATMYKNRVAQKRKLSLSWKNPDGDTTSTILQAFNPEYVWVRYLDPLVGSYQIRQFYTGDKTAPVRLITVGGVSYSSVSFDIIER